MTDVPNLFGTRDQLGEDNFSMDSRGRAVEGMVSGRLKQ